MLINQSKAESAIGLAVLVVLAVTAGVILHVKDNPNPAVLVAGQATAPAAVADLLAPPAGARVLSPVEIFNPATLSDKINGKAELYISAGFVALVTQRFAVDGPEAAWVEVYRYDMGKPANAYAVFSSQRRADARPLAIGDEAYATANAVFALAGPHYLEILAGQQGPTVMRTMEAIALALAGPAKTGGGPAEAELFPPDGLVADSVSLQAANAFGFERLDNVFTARYAIAGGQATVFFSRRQSATNATDLAAAYAGFLKDYGGAEQPGPMANSRLIAIMDAYELIFTAGPFLAGVHEASDIETAQTLATLLQARLSEAGHGR